jgi:hypothetical protein
MHIKDWLKRVSPILLIVLLISMVNFPPPAPLLCCYPFYTYCYISRLFNPQKYFAYCRAGLITCVGRNSSVGVATGYGMDGLGIESC